MQNGLETHQYICFTQTKVGIECAVRGTILNFVLCAASVINKFYRKSMFIVVSAKKWPLLGSRPCNSFYIRVNTTVSALFRVGIFTCRISCHFGFHHHGSNITLTHCFALAQTRYILFFSSLDNASPDLPLPSRNLRINNISMFKLFLKF